MKTCEEYVLHELEEAKEKIRKLTEKNERLLDEVERYIDYFHVLKKYMHVEEGSTGLQYITMNYVFKEYEPEDFESLMGGLVF